MTNYNDKFLNLLEYPLDPYQEKALKTTKNAVIAAGAGSGKTQVLATRFAWLVMTKQAKAEEILTLTFTNKAAAEMYQRIYQSLYMFANAPVSENLTAEQKQLAADALDNFSNVHIQTLDSYCSSIVRQCANRYGIKPDFTTGSADSERQIKDQAFIFILQNAQNLAVQTYADAGKLQDFAENIFARIILEYTSLSTPKDFFKTNFNKQVEAITKAWNGQILGKDTVSLNRDISDISNELASSSKKDDKDKAAYVEQLKSVFAKVYELQDQPPLTPDDVKKGSDQLFTQLKMFEDLVTKVHFVQGMKGSIKKVGTEFTKFRDKINEYFVSIPAFIKEYEAEKSLNELLDSFLEQINTSKRVSGNLTFADITELALKVLLENEDIRNQEKNAYKRIMIDEFQDNNAQNRDLLYLLSLKPGEFEENGKCVIKVNSGKSIHDQIIIKDSEGNIIEDKRVPDKLFFVGDEKQSIYKFRGAEVSVFNELTKKNENETVQMVNNYRSTPELVQAFNVLFKNGNGIFDSHKMGEPDPEYEAYYDYLAEKKDVKPLPQLNINNIPIHAVCLHKNDINNTDNFIPENDQMAYYMAQKIYEMAWQKKNWNDFAILARSRSHYELITKYLNLFGIPFNVDQQKNIFSDGIINDFYSFLRICVYPSDVNAMAAYFTSPLCGITENGAEIIISYLNENIDDKTASFQLSDKYDAELQKDLSATDFERFCNARTFFEENKKLVLCQTITKTISDLWNKKGYKYEAILSQQIELNAEHFDMLFELARQADEGGYTVSWFIDQLDKLKSTYKKDSADLDAEDITYPVEKKASVNIMTIHKSKGLEFDHVFLYGCTEYSPKSNKTMYFYDDEYGVSIKPENGGGNYFAVMSSELAKKKELAEFRRVIYVGVTRAVKDLYIVCKYNIPKNKEASSDISFRLFENIIKSRYNDPTLQEFKFYPELGFDYIPIKTVTYANIIHHKKVTCDQLRQNILETKAASLSAAPELIFEQHPIPRSTPSSLEPDFNQSQAEDSDSGEKYEQSEDVLQQAGFTAADFGTLVHAYLEAQANGIKPEEFVPEQKLLKNLSDAEIAQNRELCISMCKEFAQSEPGKQLEDAKQNRRFFRAEWAFRMFLDGTIFTGSIDLIYQNADGTYTIVDYKSDTQIDVSKYVGQQKCYRTAASKMLKVPEEKIELQLYFLRHKLCKSAEDVN